jgi:hypothetical protein
MLNIPQQAQTGRIKLSQQFTLPANDPGIERGNRKKHQAANSDGKQHDFSIHEEE